MAIKAGRISIHDANDLDESSCCASEGPSRLPHVGCGLINESQTLRLARLFVGNYSTGNLYNDLERSSRQHKHPRQHLVKHWCRSFHLFSVRWKINQRLVNGSSSQGCCG